MCLLLLTVFYTGSLRCSTRVLWNDGLLVVLRWKFPTCLFFPARKELEVLVFLGELRADFLFRRLLKPCVVRVLGSFAVARHE